MNWHRTACATNTPVRTYFLRTSLFAAHGGGLHTLVGPRPPPAGLRDDRIPGTDQAARGGRHGQKLHSGFPPGQGDARSSTDAVRNMRRAERMTVQGPVKKQEPDGMSRRGSRALLAAEHWRGAGYHPLSAGLWCDE